MAAILLADCDLYSNYGDFKETIIVTPSTADSADTIDISALVGDGLPLGIIGWDVEGGDTATATYNVSTGVVTIDAAGGTTNHTYAITVRFIGKTFTP